MKLKRFMAYLIDVFIVALITSFIFMLPFFNSDKYVNESSNLIESVLNKDLSLEDIENKQYEYYKSVNNMNILSVGVMFMYFGVFAFVCNGETIGKKIMKLRIVSCDDKELRPGLFILRQLILTNIIFSALKIISIMYMSRNDWFMFNNYVSTISDVVLWINLGFIVFRSDMRALHDIIGKTKVISTK